MCFELDDPDLKVIVDNILDPVKTIFIDGTFVKPDNVHHYSAIIGPSFMGKSQFSFILARIHPVFYFNFFREPEDPQKIYSCFNSYSVELFNILSLDKASLSKFFSSTKLSESGYTALSFNEFYDKMSKIVILFCIHNLLCSCSSF
jgi:hypothetical protein